MREHRKNGSAIHNGRFEEKLAPVLRRKIAQFTVGVHYGPLVGADRVRTGFQSSTNVANRGLAAATLERTGFQEHVGSGCGEPLADVTCFRSAMFWWPAMLENSSRIKAARVGYPADSSRCHSCEFPGDSKFLLKAPFLRHEQAHKFLPHISKADQRETISANGESLREQLVEPTALILIAL